MLSGKQVKLFLVDGTPGGVTTAEITNWTGHVLSGRRSDLGELLRRDECDRTGIYFLLGEDQETIGKQLCYIGEADTVATRLRKHDKEKDFWQQVVIVTSKDTNLTKSHARYLESRLIKLASDASRVSLENGTNPPLPPLPEADASDMEFFITQLQIVLPVLGVNVIRGRRISSAPEAVSQNESPEFTLFNSKNGVEARAQQIDGEFVMLAGSRIVGEWSGRGTAESTQRAYAGYRAQHEALIADGSVVVEGCVGVLKRDVVFSSPSTAGAIALGRSCNGRTSWVSSEGTFGQWESRGVENSGN